MLLQDECLAALLTCPRFSATSGQATCLSHKCVCEIFSGEIGVCAGGVFEEALAQAAYFLNPGSPIARTVRNAEIIDNVWESGSLSPQAGPCPRQLATVATFLFGCCSITCHSTSDVLLQQFHMQHYNLSALTDSDLR